MKSAIACRLRRELIGSAAVGRREIERVAALTFVYIKLGSLSEFVRVSAVPFGAAGGIIGHAGSI